MIFLIAAILFSSCIVLTFKFIDRFRINLLQAISVNYLLAVLWGYAYTYDFFSSVSLIDIRWLPYAAGSGLLFILAFLMFGLSTRQVGIAITGVSGKMSVILPVITGFVIFSEALGILRIAGILIALAAFYLTFKPEGRQVSFRAIRLYPFLLFLATGFNDSLMKYAQVRVMGNDLKPYLTIVFAVCLLLSVVLLFAKNRIKPECWTGRVILAGIILGVCNWLSTLFMVRAMTQLDSSLLFPVFNASIVSLAAIYGVVFFKEKLRLINWLGVALAIVAIIMIAA
jgi:drug/metabolite transporter (DMT)-like permease